jgi:hypothetical protein
MWLNVQLNVFQDVGATAIVAAVVMLAIKNPQGN